MKIPHLLRVSLLLFATIFSIGRQSFAEIIPANRIIDWTPGTVTGVIGGIPNRTKIYKNLVTGLGADNTGATDCSSILKTAIDGCPANQVVYLPAGTYRISNRVLEQFQNNVTIRGAGQGQTILMAHTGGAEPLHFGTSPYPRPSSSLDITGGATKGSAVVTMSDTSTVTVGKIIRIEKPNPTWVKDLTGNGSAMSALFKVTAKTATTVTLNHPLPIDFTNGARLAVYSSSPAVGMGIEDLTIDLINSTAFTAIYFEMMDGSWIKNVEIKNAYSRQIFFLWCTNCEVRRCYIHDSRGTGPNHEGVDFYENGCWNLVEDNVIKAAGYPSIVLGDSAGGCAGNVIAYNYIKDVLNNAGIAGDSICDNHGAFNFMNLIEGNVAQSFESDGYKGGSGYNTLFRNYFSGEYPGGDAIQRVVALKHMAVYYSVVGNVLGYPNMAAAYDIELQSYNGYGANNVIYQLGYPNAGNTSYSGTIAATTPPNYVGEASSISATPQKLDLNVKATLIRHGNYDYLNKATLWDTSISDKTIPSSLIYSAKPSWWPSTAPWPPIGPDMTPMVSEIPAQTRFRTPPTTAPSPPSNLRQAP